MMIFLITIGIGFALGGPVGAFIALTIAIIIEEM